MIDREVLAAALEKPWPVHWEKNSIIAAATKYLAQLPESCRCGGSGLKTNDHGFRTNEPCPDCHGSGKVYPAELVARIVTTIYEMDRLDPPGTRGRYDRVAVAVLDALNGTADG